MENLYRELDAEFRKSPFAELAPLVVGEGNPHPRLVLIGEAPGEQEALQRRPFVGKAGKNLMEFLSVLNLTREEIYITNVAKFRPWKISKAGRIINRPPTRPEIDFFVPFLRKEVRLLHPEIIVTLGNTALQAFLPETIGAVHGELQNVSIAEEAYALLPLYHPASVIYNPPLKATYLQDLQKLDRILKTVSR